MRVRLVRDRLTSILLYGALAIPALLIVAGALLPS